MKGSTLNTTNNRELLQTSSICLQQSVGSKPCICGCNTPNLFSQRHPDLPCSQPTENFKSAFLAHSNSDTLPVLVLPTGEEIELYHLFHCILSIRQQFGRIKWRLLTRVICGHDASRESRHVLKSFYWRQMRSFDLWIHEKGPVRMGCVGDSVVINILKEFIDNQTLLSSAPSTVDEIPSKTPVQDEISCKAPMKDKIYNSGIDEILCKTPDIDNVICKEEHVLQKAPEIDNVLSKDEILHNASAIDEIQYKLPGFFDGPRPRPIFKVKKPRKIPKKHVEIHVPNRMAREFREKNPSELKFKTDFRSRYLPIEMQEELQRQETMCSSSTHFIRKKQSAMNLKRCCGVTYVKPTESKQEGVEEIFEPLPPLAFQVGTADRLLSPEEKPHYLHLAKKFVKRLVSGLIRITVQTQYGEIELKKFLLGELPEGEEILVDNCRGLWALFKRDNFVTLHFQKDPECLIRPAPPGKRGNVIIGFLVKKGLCGLKSVKRCLGLPEEEGDPLNIQASQLRLELYVHKQDWKEATLHVKKSLCALISEFEVYIQKQLPEWNKIRETIFKTKVFTPPVGFYTACPCKEYEKSIETGKLIRGEGAGFEYLRSEECMQTVLRDGNEERASREAENLVENLPDILEENSKQNLTENRAGKWTFTNQIVTPQLKMCLSCGNDISKPYSNFDTSLISSKNAPLLFYLINTRDSFSYDLKVLKSYINCNGNKVLKKVYCFYKYDLPDNFKNWEENLEGEYVKTGIVTYTGCFSQGQLKDLEEQVDRTEKDFLRGMFIRNTAQPSYGPGGHLKRTKFFFGSRYMWTACQLAERQSGVAAGVRVDVSRTPVWMMNAVEKPLVEAGVIEPNFINSIAMNIYHDGKEGLAQHFDDAVRFKQPIFTVKLGSDSRLSFGSQFYGYLNGAFTIPCPRGVVCVMEEFSYAANCAKHCVRPYDLSGRSVTMILRQIHPFIMDEAARYDVEIDFPTWFSCLSLEDDSVAYSKQKEMEAKQLMKNKA